MASIEEQIEEHYKGILQALGVRYYGKTEQINSKISTALASSVSKGGGSGMNYPDIKLLLENTTRRDIPVMIEVKGTRGKLEKLDKNGEIVGVTQWASDGKLGKTTMTEFSMKRIGVVTTSWVKLWKKYVTIIVRSLHTQRPTRGHCPLTP